MHTLTHTQYMSLALQMAEQGRYTVSPNPMVGCVIVKNNTVIGQGYHQAPGMPHAEVYALKEAGKNAKDSIAYVTLEPCCHHGKTPPCTQALIAAGIKKVFISTQDPNPLVNGKGIEALKSAGIEVEVGICEKQAYDLNEIFFHFIKTKKPFIIAKWAMSFDGKTCVSPNDTKDISCLASRKHSHQIRKQVDAILVGAETARDDNPQLTARFLDQMSDDFVQPIRIILAGKKPIPDTLRIFSREAKSRTILATTEKNKGVFEHLSSENTEILILSESKSGDVDVHHLCEELGKRNISSLLVEGGSKVHQSFIEANLVNKFQVYLSPVIIGNLEHKKSLELLSFNQIDKDFYFEGKVQGVENV